MSGTRADRACTHRRGGVADSRAPALGHPSLQRGAGFCSGEREAAGWVYAEDHTQSVTLTPCSAFRPLTLLPYDPQGPPSPAVVQGGGQAPLSA